MIEIKISSLWKYEFALQVSTNSKIIDLKQQICRQTLIPTDNLKLLIVKEQNQLDPLEEECTQISACQFSKIPEVRYVIEPKNLINILIQFENGSYIEQIFEQSDSIKDLYDYFQFQGSRLNQQYITSFKLSYEQQILEQSKYFYNYQFSTYETNIIKAMDTRDDIKIIFKLGEIQQQIEINRTKTLSQFIEQIITSNQNLRNKEFQLLHNNLELNDKDQTLQKLGLNDSDFIVAIQKMQS